MIDLLCIFNVNLKKKQSTVINGWSIAHLGTSLNSGMQFDYIVWRGRL